MRAWQVSLLRPVLPSHATAFRNMSDLLHRLRKIRLTFTCKGSASRPSNDARALWILNGTSEFGLSRRQSIRIGVPVQYVVNTCVR